MGGWVGCAKSFSCQTQLSLNCVKLFWGCGWGFDNIGSLLKYPKDAIVSKVIGRNFASTASICRGGRLCQAGSGGGGG